MRAFRVHGRVHSGLLPWLAISVVVIVLGGWALLNEYQHGWLNLHFGFGFICIVGTAAMALYLGWKALIAHGAIPLVVVWRRGDALWAGTAMAPFGLSRRRIRLQGRDVRVKLLDAPRQRQASGQVFYPRITSGGASVDLRSHGEVDPQELQKFLVSCADAFGGFPATNSEGP